MIQKIISGGQTGADRAALDAAIKLDIPHGGWIPKGRKAEDGVIPEKYQMQEMPTPSYPKRTEMNVIDSDGTLIFTHGNLKGGSKLTGEYAEKNSRPCLHIDLSQRTAFVAVTQIADWLTANNIEILNVAGSSAGKDSKIYNKTYQILTSVYTIMLSDLAGRFAPSTASLGKDPHPTILSNRPKTVAEAVRRLVSEMSLKDRAVLSNMTKDELITLDSSLGSYIRDNFGIQSGNEELLNSCRFVSGNRSLTEKDAALVIVKELWKELKATHKLRIIK